MTMVDPSKPLAAALGKVPSGLFILTVGRGQAETGMLASWVQQCSFARRGSAWPSNTGATSTPGLFPSAGSRSISSRKGRRPCWPISARASRLSEPAFTGLEVRRQDGERADPE